MQLCEGACSQAHPGTEADPHAEVLHKGLSAWLLTLCQERTYEHCSPRLTDTHKPASQLSLQRDGERTTLEAASSPSAAGLQDETTKALLVSMTLLKDNISRKACELQALALQPHFSLKGRT